MATLSNMWDYMWDYRHKPRPALQWIAGQYNSYSSYRQDCRHFRTVVDTAHRARLKCPRQPQRLPQTTASQLPWHTHVQTGRYCCKAHGFAVAQSCMAADLSIAVGLALEDIVV